MVHVFFEKLLPWARKGHGIYLGQRSYFLLLHAECNGNDGLIMSCCAEGRASSSDEPVVMGEAQLPRPWSCVEEPA